MTNVLVIGGAGCLGSHICEHLFENKYRVAVFDNFTTGSLENLEAIKEKIEIVHGDVSDNNNLESFCSKFSPHYIINASASYDDPANYKRDLSVNVLGLLNIIQISKKLNVKKLINLQSTHYYGQTDAETITENMKGHSVGSYGLTKALSEEYLVMSDLPYVSLRLSTVLCERLKIGPVPTFYQRIKAGKDCFCTDAIRDFTGLRDFLEIVKKSIESPVTGSFNVSSGKPTSVKEIYNAVNKALNFQGPMEVKEITTSPDDLKRLVLNSQKAEAAFNMKFSYELEKWVQSCVDWYENTGEFITRSHIQSISEKNLGKKVD